MARAMLPHVVAQGEHLEKLAFARGAGAKEVWEDPKNEAIRALRKDPLVLAPGDVVYLPSGPRDSLPLTKGAANWLRGVRSGADAGLDVFTRGQAPSYHSP